ncbi:MAG: large conductance mechanosensitive channel protein MscL [Bacteroidota bacterium]|jgi:large conductance mechanosensitive channel
MLNEFKKFIAQGNVLDLAVAVIIGGAFGKIISSLVDDIIMPIVGVAIGGRNFSSMAVTIGEATIKYGNFIQMVVQFLIIAWVIFIIVKGANKLGLTDKNTDEKA